MIGPVGNKNYYTVGVILVTVKHSVFVPERERAGFVFEYTYFHWKTPVY